MNGGKDGKGGKGGKKRNTAEALDADLDKYWIKKGEKGAVKNHLDSEMDEYWKGEGKGKQSDNNFCMDNTKVSNSVDGSMLMSMHELNAKDICGASP